MINVYAANATDFSTNGIATLEPTLCELAMTINGAWVLTLEHSFDENNKYINLDNAEPIRPELKKGNIIKVTDIAALRDCDSTQLFRIYDTVKTLTSIRVTAFPVGMEATYDSIIEELKLNNKNGKQVISELIAAADEVTSGSDIGKYTLSIESSFPTSKKRSVNYKNTNLIAALCGSDEGSFVNKFNAEVAYNNYEIKVKKRLGSGTDYDVRLGKNLTGLSFEIDDSAVVTRLYPISQDDLRLKDDTDRRYIPGYEIRYIDSENESYPYVRAAFVEVPYSLIDTDIEAQVPTATAVLTETVYNAVYDEIYRLMYEFWTDILEDNEFSYTGTSSFDISLIPEFVQANIKDVSEAVANNVLGTSLDNVYVAHPGLRSWLTNAIRAGMDWISEIDLPEKGWIENQDGSYSYGTDLRNLKNEWAYIDRKMSYFNNNEKWEKEKDDSYEWDWVQKKGQRKKFGNNKRYLARNTYVYDYDGGCKYYWFDEEGWWDGTSESSGWAWHQDSTGWWFGDADPDGDDSKYIHDDWAFIRETADSPRKLYYFNSDGYLDGEEVVDWNWHKVNGKRYFGSTDHEKRATYLVSQWMQIEGDWRLFDSNGYVEDLEATKAALISALSIYLQEEAGSLIATEQNALFDLLYSNMEEYCKDLYDNGLDKPSINVSVDFVDLSKTQEYAAYSNLEKICLGDDVEVHDPVHGIDAITERVMGLTYDCIRGYNTKIEVGGVSSVTSLFDTSVKGTGSEQRLVAGENVTIDGNVINVSANTGDVYAGDKVSVTQLQTTGQPIAKIYVNGMPTTIYAVGSDVEVEPIKQSGDHIATITVGGVDYNIYADTGLKYWVETQTDIYREGSHTETTYDDSYYFDEVVYWKTNSLHSYHGHWDFKKANDIPAYIGKVATGEDKHFILVSEDEDGVDWLVNDTGITNVWAEPPNGEYSADYKHTGNITYKGKTYYYSVGKYYYDTPHTETDSFSYVPNVDANSPYADMARAIIDATEITTTLPDIFGVSNNPDSDKILWYSSNGTHASHTDDVYITKDGVFNGTEFRINGQTLGGFYKTTLYQGNTYSASVSLSDSYRDYDLLMIETYNQDDKNNYASMVSVADLSVGSYIGVSGYLMYTIANARSLTFHEAPNDSNHSRYIKAVYGFRTTHDSGTVPPLEDVVVDGISVVSGGVASISLSGKQDALTAGANVQISAQNVISATDTTYSDFSGSSHGLVPPVQTQSGKFLKDDGTWASGAGGASNLVDLGDVNISSPSNSQVLQYDSTSQKWINANGGGGFIETNSADYENLTPAEKADASKLYFVKDSGTVEVDTDIEPVGFYNVSEGSVAITVNGAGKLQYAWNGGTTIGAMSVYQVAIPATVKKIKFKITTGSAYSTSNPAWYVCVGLKRNYVINNWSYANDSDFLISSTFSTTNSVFEGELDCSGITTNAYLYIIAHGWSMVVDSLKMTVEQTVAATRLMYKDVPYAAIKGMKSDDYEDLTPAEQSNGTIYFVTPSGTGNNKLFFMGDEYGGSGAYAETILYDGLNSSAPSSITLSDDYTNYDEIIFCLLRSADGRMYKYHRVYLVSDLNINDSIQMQTYSEYWGIEITSASVFTTISASGMYIDKIIGIKH